MVTGRATILPNTTDSSWSCKAIRLQATTFRLCAARMLQDLPCPGGGNRIEKDVSEAYVKRIAGDIQLTRPMRVALDAGNGAAGPIAVRVLRACGAEVTELYCDVDGDFPNHHPNPSDAKNLRA